MKKLALLSSMLLLASCGFVEDTPNADGDMPTADDACVEHADCGNDQLCIDGACDTSCAGVGEKCSETRVCCFQDVDSDDANDAQCAVTEEDPDERCRVPEVVEDENMEDVDVEDEDMEDEDMEDVDVEDEDMEEEDMEDIDVDIDIDVEDEDMEDIDVEDEEEAAEEVPVE